MKLYGLFPCDENFYNDAEGARLLYEKTTPLIAQMVYDALRADEDQTLYTSKYRYEISDGLDRQPDDVFGDHRFYNLTSKEELMVCITRMIDPYDSFWMPIKSRITCRQIRGGYDGQAVICLCLEDPVPISPDTSLIEVIERTADLVEGDWFDGYEETTDKLSSL